MPSSPASHRHLYFAYQFYQSFPKSISAEDFIKKHPVLLTESSFRFTELQKIPISPKKGLPNLVDYFLGSGNKIKSLWKPGIELENIRLRLRLADMSDSSGSVFRLRLYALGTGASFNLDKITRAGNEQIVDLFTYDARSKKVLTGSELKRANQYSVPPTFLMPHSFQVD